MKQKKAYSTNLLIRFLVFIVFSSFIFRFRIRKNMPAEVKNLQPPYLVLANHVGFWDPFLAGHFLKPFTHFVSSDAVFRNPLLRFFLTRLGTIPKKKNMRDSQVIRDIVTVIKQGENVGIFPEAVRNWSGTTSPMDPSIGKLIKMLKVPVVVPLLKGMNLLNPRWAFKMRSYPMEIDYKLLFTKEDVLAMDSTQLFDGLTQALHHDEVAFQEKQRIPLGSNKRAEHISHALYLCPNCMGIDTFWAKKNDFECKSCKLQVHIDEFSFFKPIKNEELKFNNIRDWFNWEEKTLVEMIRHKFRENSPDIFFQDIDMHIFKNDAKGRLILIGKGDVLLFRDKIQVKFYDRDPLNFNFNDLQTINPQTKERLEIFYKNDAYRIAGSRAGVSALKWEVAVNTIWKEMGLTAKMVPYIRV